MAIYSKNVAFLICTNPRFILENYKNSPDTGSL